MKSKKAALENFSLLLLGIILFAIPHPTFVFEKGFPLFSYFSFVPIFILIKRCSWKSVWLYGFLYGLGGYAFLTSWLATFNPAAMPVISIMYGLYLSIAFVLMKLAGSLWKKHFFYAEWVVWCAYEYVKTLGFTGFNYGVTAYSQWRWPLIIQSSDLIGAFGLSAFISFFSAWLAAVICEKKVPFAERIKKHAVAGSVWFSFLLFIVVYGIFSPVDYSSFEKRKIALIQTNSDPWSGGTATYKRDLRVLKRLSDQAIAENPDLSLVVWPETAFVPRIRWHYKFRQDAERFELVNDLLTYIDGKNVPFLIGSDDGVEGYDSGGVFGCIDYNAALLFRPGQNVIPPEPETYWKRHLVPFTEHFPYKKQLPFVYMMLKENDTHFWEAGKESVVFDVGGLKFGTPICFEDTFGYISRDYVNKGAVAIVNISNDAWAKSVNCQMQHLTMGLFRCVENRIPAVRSTASGQTVVIDPNGRIIESAEPFKEAFIIGEVPVMTGRKTLYTRFGDYPGIIFVVLGTILILAGSVKYIAERKRS